MAGSGGGGVVPVHTLISLRKNQSMLSTPVNDMLSCTALSGPGFKRNGSVRLFTVFLVE